MTDRTFAVTVPAARIADARRAAARAGATGTDALSTLRVVLAAFPRGVRVTDVTDPNGGQPDGGIARGVLIHGFVGRNGRDQTCFFAHSRADGIPIDDPWFMGSDRRWDRRIHVELAHLIDPPDLR